MIQSLGPIPMAQGEAGDGYLFKPHAPLDLLTLRAQPTRLERFNMKHIWDVTHTPNPSLWGLCALRGSTRAVGHDDSRRTKLNSQLIL